MSLVHFGTKAEQSSQYLTSLSDLPKKMKLLAGAPMAPSANLPHMGQSLGTWVHFFSQWRRALSLGHLAVIWLTPHTPLSGCWLLPLLMDFARKEESRKQDWFQAPRAGWHQVDTYVLWSPCSFTFWASEQDDFLCERIQFISFTLEIALKEISHTKGKVVFWVIVVLKIDSLNCVFLEIV